MNDSTESLVYVTPYFVYLTPYFIKIIYESIESRVKKANHTLTVIN